MAERTLRFEARGRFQVPPDRLWPLVSDTQRLNRALKLPVIRFTTEPLATGGARVVGAHPFGSAVLAMLGQMLPLDPLWVSDERILRRLPQFPLVRWIDHPFEWEAPRRYAVRREYFWSLLGLFPFRSFYGGVELTRAPAGGTDARSFIEVVPRNLQGALLTRLALGPKNAESVIRQCRIFERYLLGEADSPFPQLERKQGSGPHPRLHPLPVSDGEGDSGGSGGRAALPPSAPALERPSVPSPSGMERGGAERRGEVAPVAPPADIESPGWSELVRTGVAAPMVERLRRHLLEAPDEDVLKMRAFELADRWGVDRRETLVMFLHATTAGLVEMSWDVLCPNCRIAKAGASSLADLPSQAHCESCNITFDAAFDEQVEVRFTAAEGLRHIEDRRFCSGGPMNLPHVLGQLTLAPGTTRTLSLALGPGKYRLRSVQSKATAVVDVGDRGSDAADSGATGDGTAVTGMSSPAGDGEGDGVGVAAFAVAPDAIRPPLAAAAAGILDVRLENQTGVEAIVALEKPEWPETAATAAVVGTIQEFRDLFGSEALAPGLQLAIQRLTFLFTDLTGSTAMYEAVGQARAFRLVQDHFHLLGSVIAAHRGALVKTIGDAIMATFPTPADAVGAALAMQQAIRQLDTAGAVDAATLLKVGIHDGPCIAVGANGRLDYFGTTINVTARVNHEARGGEVVLTAPVYADPAVRQQVADAQLRVGQGEARLRGVREPVVLYRLADGVSATTPAG